MFPLCYCDLGTVLFLVANSSYNVCYKFTLSKRILFLLIALMYLCEFMFKLLFALFKERNNELISFCKIHQNELIVILYE